MSSLTDIVFPEVVSKSTSNNVLTIAIKFVMVVFELKLDLVLGERSFINVLSSFELERKKRLILLYIYYITVFISERTRLNTTS